METAEEYLKPLIELHNVVSKYEDATVLFHTCRWSLVELGQSYFDIALHQQMLSSFWNLLP